MEVQGRHAKIYKGSMEMSDEVDRISSLPDCLRLHILSFLEMPDVVNTSLLSTRWRYLWTSISCLDFDTDNFGDGTDNSTFITNSLLNSSCPKLQRLRILCFYEDTDNAKIDSWIYFAMRHNVEELILDLQNNMTVSSNKWYGTRYKLPQSLYSCSSLKSLTLSYCDLNMASSICLCSLETLDLDLLDLSTETITHLTSNCPLLKDLTLNGCNMYSDLNIVLTNKKLKYLTIFDYDKTADSDTQVIICAPYIESLNFQYGLLRKKYCIKNMKSLVEVRFVEILHEVDHHTIYGEKDLDHVSVALLRDLHYVVKMHLDMFIVQILSIREMQGIHPFGFSATSLHLETELTKWELPGISHLLKSSPRLKSLIIKFPKSMDEIQFDEVFKDKCVFEEKEYWKSEEHNFSSTLQNLEFVKIYFLSDSQEYSNLEDDLKKLRNKIEFAQFLLKNSVGLKKMIIKCGNNIQENSELLSKLSEKLIHFPGASRSSTVDII